MEPAYMIIFYIVSFFSVYVQIFFLVTFLEKRRSFAPPPASLDLPDYPTVTIIVPCYNEEFTVDKTINSLRALDYPQEKISIILVDDGSIDNTWTHIQKYDGDPQIKVFKKKNGGKHTALNLGLQHTTSDFVGCLDADSQVHAQALKRIMAYFQNDPDAMAVLPSIVVDAPKNLVQYAQKIEYEMAIYNKKMLGLNGGIHVTPGPFSIFRKKVFDDLGPYRKAHNTEDQEIALRMQEHGYKIDHCPVAYVYTSSPDTIAKLVRQRIRWIYGFLKNMIDYKRLIFKKKYGTVAVLTMPSGLITIAGALLLFFIFLWDTIVLVYHKIIQIQTVGLAHSFPSTFSFSWFFVSTQMIFFLVILAYALAFIAIFFGKRLAQQKLTYAPHLIYFFLLYSVIAPFWLMKAVYNVLRSKEESWTLERNTL
jgi:cellulose synthase/poly-beta-1,6-N-acetylglucosamine synthase-like glycosyltransferase